ncbi:MAG: nucleotidyl transferase AbiEii/AbiGii toxin family protein [Lachnospiraceae bacterium]|nr:nucleotidyl transferase AbiEii/AbiGii toxin family protein [Lachnospiraceae bacterium]
MVNLEELANTVINEGYSEVYAEAKVCQDIVLKAIAKCSLSKNVTIKGGVVMRSLTGNVRRATQDIDFDFIRYSLSEDSIHAFIKKLNCLDGIRISISGEIEELSQQEYNGKRVYVNIEDDMGHSFISKIDLGVHKNIQIEQDEFCFDVCMDEVGACLLINSKEQILAEKLRSLLRFGPLSTRYKDIFDICYLSEHVNNDRLKRCLNTYVFEDPKMREKTMADVIRRVNITFDNRLYKKNIKRDAKANWMELPVDEAFRIIREFLANL